MAQLVDVEQIRVLVGHLISLAAQQDQEHALYLANKLDNLIPKKSGVVMSESLDYGRLYDAYYEACGEELNN